MQAFIQKIIALIMSILAFLGLTKPVVEIDPDSYKIDGNTVEFCFDSNPTTGYGWTAEIDGDCVELTKDEYVQDKVNDGPAAIAGVGGKQYYVFTAVKEGTATVTFTYARSWDQNDDDRVITAQIAVSADKTIEVKTFGAK
ncbi:MAG: protease inhibitor I42 family protein [Clostridia bacterium]|nr:protease inhibitor I42 family protein [Clostridia bacterium]